MMITDDEIAAEDAVAAREDGRAALFLAPVMVAVFVFTAMGLVLDWIRAHPFAAAGTLLAVIAVVFAVWHHSRPVTRPDPGQDRHHDAIQVLKILALANNRIDVTDREIIGAYMRGIPGNLLSMQMSEEMVGRDLPSPMDLDRHIDAARLSLESAEIGLLVEQVRLMRRNERRLTPVTREWFDRAERRLARPTGILHADRNGLGITIGTVPQEDEPPFDPGMAWSSHLERFDATASTLDGPSLPAAVTGPLGSMRSSLETMEAVHVDEDIELELDDIVDRQFAGVTASYASARALADQDEAMRADRVLASSVERLAAAVDGLVERQTGRAIAKLETVNRYIEAKNPTGDLA